MSFQCFELHENDFHVKWGWGIIWRMAGSLVFQEISRELEQVGLRDGLKDLLRIAENEEFQQQRQAPLQSVVTEQLAEDLVESFEM